MINKVISQNQILLSDMIVAYRFQQEVSIPHLKGEIKATGEAIEHTRALIDSVRNPPEELLDHLESLIISVQELNMARHLTRLTAIDMAESIREKKYLIRHLNRML